MATASKTSAKERIVVDNIHGDIPLTQTEWNVVDTASFQRLRSLKQLGMGHLVYPNATHTRFAHSIGVFGIMRRIVAILRETRRYDDGLLDNLRLAALLHDVGHYPYSHLMERVDRVTLTDEEIGVQQRREIDVLGEPYPDHETLGRFILSSQRDLQKAVGGKARADEIGALFSRLPAADSQISKLIHSSLDMDRLDYLLRDARAAGVPYGEIDHNYLLNNIHVSATGALGVAAKALPAAEHFLIARLYMHRVVYYHKTTFGMEEACRQLLKRLRQTKRFKSLARDGNEIREICKGERLSGFTDSYVDNIIREATGDTKDVVIQTLARCINSRTPPKLIHEVCGLHERGKPFADAAWFKQTCVKQLPALAKKYRLELGQFLLCGPKPISVEERGPMVTPDEAKKMPTDDREELIKVFIDGLNNEPKPLVQVKGSVIQHMAGQQLGILRLYLADVGDNADKKAKAIQQAVKEWIPKS